MNPLVFIFLLAFVFLAVAAYFFKVFNRLQTMLRQAGLKIPVYLFVTLSLIAGFVAGLIVFLLARSLTATVMTAAIVVAAPSIFAFDKRRRRFHEFLSQLPDAMDLMIRSLRDGHSFISALQVIATEMPEPIAREFGRAYEEQSLGLNMKSALENLVDRVPILELKLCVTAALIHRDLGGALSETLRNIGHTIRERSRIHGAIWVKSAEARWPGYIVSALPLSLFFLINLFNPTYMKTFYDHKYGVYTLGAGAAMQIAGWLIIRRIVNIQESPSSFLSRRALNRKRRISRALPDALDLMVVCVEAGLDLNAALQRVGREMGKVGADLSEELTITSHEIRDGIPRDQALRNLGDRAGVADLQSLAATLTQADRLGTSIAFSLRVFADAIRKQRRQGAEKLVARATIKLIFPLLLCIFPALLIVLLGPAIIEVSDLFRR